jgi:hypothetical protein
MQRAVARTRAAVRTKLVRFIPPRAPRAVAQRAPAPQAPAAFIQAWFPLEKKSCMLCPTGDRRPGSSQLRTPGASPECISCAICLSSAL